ncbi:MAG TPA: hypothetical protein VNY84_11515 [Acidimicrobiales bacterium]|nr:hypothetical protein [Acidimicrobiales bacterium]
MLLLVVAVADNPPTSMPWWMATTIVIGWLATVGAIVLLARKRRRLARDRRPQVLAGRPEGPDEWALPRVEGPPDNRTLPAGPPR